MLRQSLAGSTRRTTTPACRDRMFPWMSTRRRTSCASSRLTLSASGGACGPRSATCGLSGRAPLSTRPRCSGGAAMPDNGAYIAAKHGVHGLTRAAALELGGTGIRVNAIAPGVTRTGMTSGVSDELLRRVPLARIAEPEEIAAAVVWLCSPEASYITGSMLVADGGWLAG